MALSPVLALPTRRIIASSSVSVKVWAPFSRSLALGRSSAGHSLILVWYRVTALAPCQALREVSSLRSPVSSTITPGLVQYSQDKTFEIFAFWMMKTNGVIKGVAKSLNNADFATRVDGGTENDLLEEI